MNKYFYLLICVISIFSGCILKDKEKHDTETTTISVISEQVKKIITTNEIAISGDIEGNKTIRLGFLQPGRINYIATKEGEPVSKGQLLASLDTTSYAIANEMADIHLKSVADEFNRLTIMHDRGSISDGDYSKITFGLQEARIQQKLQKQNLLNTKLYSPISGILLKRLAEVGEIIGVGVPILIISDISTVKVNAYVPENELHNIKLGQKASVLISSLNHFYSGKVVQIGALADNASRAFSIKIELPNPEQLIQPGMIAEVKLNANKSREILIIPTEAVLHDLNNQTYIYIADTMQHKAFKRKISVGSIINSQIEITAGISENEMIITGGQHKLSDGAPINFAQKK